MSISLIKKDGTTVEFEPGEVVRIEVDGKRLWSFTPDWVFDVVGHDAEQRMVADARMSGQLPPIVRRDQQIAVAHREVWIKPGTDVDDQNGVVNPLGSDIAVT